MKKKYQTPTLLVQPVTLSDAVAFGINGSQDMDDSEQLAKKRLSRHFQSSEEEEEAEDYLW